LAVADANGELNAHETISAMRQRPVRPVERPDKDRMKPMETFL